MDYLCFDLETYDSKLVYDFVSSLNVYNPMSQLKLYKNNNTSRLNNIKIFDFHSHKNTEINIVNNMLALVGENDVGKTSVLQALDMFFQKDEEMENHIKVEIDGKILSLESIKNKEINYFLFGSEIFSNSDIGRRTISELIDYKNENLANRNQSKRLKEQMYDILDIFKHIYDIYEFMELDIEIDKECGNLFHYSEEIKKIIDLFLEKRDLLVLFYGNENEIMENYKSIKESYPDDDADILQLKNSLDCLYKILKKFYFNENYFKSLHISSFGGTPPHLFEVLNDSSDMYFSKEILEVLLMQQNNKCHSNTIKQQWFVGNLPYIFL